MSHSLIFPAKPRPNGANFTVTDRAPPIRGEAEVRPNCGIGQDNWVGYWVPGRLRWKPPAACNVWWCIYSSILAVFINPSNNQVNNFTIIISPRRKYIELIIDN